MRRSLLPLHLASIGRHDNVANTSESQVEADCGPFPSGQTRGPCDSGVMMWEVEANKKVVCLYAKLCLEHI